MANLDPDLAKRLKRDPQGLVPAVLVGAGVLAAGAIAALFVPGLRRAAPEQALGAGDEEYAAIAA